jgi:hypothetical protein
MWPFPNPLDVFGDAVSSVTGWAWDKVIQGIYTWFANGLLLLMEWVWQVLDSATTPRLTEPWFTNGLLRPLSVLALGIVIALMLASAVQAGFAGRPELIADALKEGPKAIVATALTVTVVDILLRGADVLAEVTWRAGRGDTQSVMNGLAATVSVGGPLASTFVAPLALLFGMVGLLVTAVVLFMRSALLYLVAGFAPIVWAAGVSPVLRGSGRKLVGVAVALVLAKPAIAMTLVVGSKLIANAGVSPTGGGTDGAAALGTLVTGFSCFAIAGLSPWVVYRLLPTVEQASVSNGIVGGWGRAAMTGAQTAMLAKSLGASGAASAATRAAPGAVSMGAIAPGGATGPASGSAGGPGGSVGSIAGTAAGGGRSSATAVLPVQSGSATTVRQPVIPSGRSGDRRDEGAQP